MNNLFPDGWKSEAIDTYVEKMVGGAPLRPSDFSKSGVRVIPKKAVQFGGKTKFNINTYCTSDFASKNQKNIVNNEYIITSLRDLVPTGPTIGVIGKLEEQGEFILAQGVYGIKTKNIVNDYLIQLSNSQWYRKQMRLIFVGSTQVHIRNQEFLDVVVPIPPLPEQQKISKILTSVDEVIEKTQAQIDKLKDLKTGMMQELLTNGIGHTEFKDSPVGRIPTEWEVVKFDDIATSITCGVAAKPVYVEAENGVPFLSAQNVSKGNVLLTKYKHISPEFHKKLTKNTKPYKGDILYSRVGANYGEAAVIEFDWEFSVYVSLTLIKLSKRCENYFIKYLLNSAHGKDQAQNGVFAGGGVPNLNVAVVKAFYIALPPLEEQIKISKVILSIDRKLEAVTRKLSTLKNNKKALMQDLLTGKVRVKTETTNTEVVVG